MSKLKDCPFCGYEAEIKQDPLFHECNGTTRGYPGCYRFYVRCPQCGAVSPEKTDSVTLTESEAKKIVIDSWNNRKSEDEMLAESNETFKKRYCIMNLDGIDEDIKCVFHGFFQREFETIETGSHFAYPVAVVESPNGTLYEVSICDIHFINDEEMVE